MPIQHRRRQLMQALSLAPWIAGFAASPAVHAAPGWQMPDESAPHSATWMSFGASEDVWGGRLIRPVQAALARIARTIAEHEPVHLLVREEEHDLAARLCGPEVSLFVQDIDDLWMRDTGPVFVNGGPGRQAAVDFNFNGWGRKQAHARDAMVAREVCALAEVPRLATSLVLEGGGIEVDGEGTAIITESCVLNPNRNPRLGKAACEQALKDLLGLRQIIWLPGIAGRDITDGHTDFYARFSQPGVVVAALDEDPLSHDHAVTRRHLEILRQARDARGRPLQVVVLRTPSRVRPALETPEFAAGYVNFYVCNGAVIAPQFGDPKADADCKAVLREQFPGRAIIQLDIDAIAAGGGGIHCTTQQQPEPA